MLHFDLDFGVFILIVADLNLAGRGRNHFTANELYLVGQQCRTRQQKDAANSQIAFHACWTAEFRRVSRVLLPASISAKIACRNMPIYDYQCRSCGEQFELIVLKGTVAACPACQSQELEQLLSGFAVSSKGISEANLKAARRSYANSSTYKDKKVAEADEIREHSNHEHAPKKPK